MWRPSGHRRAEGNRAGTGWREWQHPTWKAPQLMRNVPRLWGRVQGQASAPDVVPALAHLG